MDKYLFNHIIVNGRVQGVGFRYYVKHAADRLGIKGTVTNLYNGTVEIYAVGIKESMDIFIKMVNQGPTFSQVDFLNIRELSDAESNLQTYNGFVII